MWANSYVNSDCLVFGSSQRWMRLYQFDFLTILKYFSLVLYWLTSAWSLYETTNKIYWDAFRFSPQCGIRTCIVLTKRNKWPHSFVFMWNWIFTGHLSRYSLERPDFGEVKSAAIGHQPYLFGILNEYRMRQVILWQRFLGQKSIITYIWLSFSGVCST